MGKCCSAQGFASVLDIPHSHVCIHFVPSILVVFWEHFDTLGLSCPCGFFLFFLSVIAELLYSESHFFKLFFPCKEDW